MRRCGGGAVDATMRRAAHDDGDAGGFETQQLPPAQPFFCSPSVARAGQAKPPSSVSRARLFLRSYDRCRWGVVGTKAARTTIDGRT